MNKKMTAILFALLAAALYAVNIPLSKLLLQDVEPVFMAAFLYFGAGLGMSAYSVFTGKLRKEDKLTKKELPYTIGMIILDIAAPICLMIGLSEASSANASLLNNFEIAATSVIALFVFKEVISRKMWLAILLIILSSILLSFEGAESLQFSYGSIYVLLACMCWGLENNCTRMLSSKSTIQIVVLKGVFSGLGSFVVAVITGERLPSLIYIVYVLVLGFVSYGLSIFFYVKAQNELGAAKTSACYAVSPFVGALLSFIILREALSKTYLIALIVMAAGTVLVVLDTLLIRHRHRHTHTVVHTHDGNTHEHTVVHEHGHRHLLNKQGKHFHKHIHSKI